MPETKPALEYPLNPLQLNMLIQVYWDPDLNPFTAAQIEAARDLHQKGLVVYQSSVPLQRTERGKAHVDLLMATPFPVPTTRWVTPSKETI